MLLMSISLMSSFAPPVIRRTRLGPCLSGSMSVAKDHIDVSLWYALKGYSRSLSGPHDGGIRELVTASAAAELAILSNGPGMQKTM